MTNRAGFSKGSRALHLRDAIASTRPRKRVDVILRHARPFVGADREFAAISHMFRYRGISIAPAWYRVLGPRVGSVLGSAAEYARVRSADSGTTVTRQTVNF